MFYTLNISADFRFVLDLGGKINIKLDYVEFVLKLIATAKRKLIDQI